MILKKLEIAGFKSFGKKVELVFDTPVTAIVGPNGSGKSNVSEAIRWVLGEQSMKSLRGKRGEDLIFHGSDGASQLGKARVSIVFENKKHVFPLDFTELTISREVYRDGANEYRLNDSQVRLKDIIELMSNVGVGGSAHHIISQGEADRLLWASPKERKNMLEDALGLRIYHIKQIEAERKLAATEENMREVGMLRREIQPHMRFLREQAVKVEASVKLREELREALQDYLSREEATLQKDREKTQHQINPLAKSFELLKKTVEELRAAVAMQQEDTARAMPDEWEKLTERLSQLEEKRRSIERDVGRLEGRRSVLQPQKKDSNRVLIMSAERVRKEFQTILMLIEKAVSMETLEKVRKVLQTATTHVKQFLSGAEEDEVGASEQDDVALEREHNDLLQQRAETEKEQQELFSLRDTIGVSQQASRDLLIQNQRDLRKKEEELYQLRDTMRSLEMEQEQIRMRQVEFRRECEEATPYEVKALKAHDAHTWTGDERDKARHAIGRLKIKLEEAGGIDPQVVREFEEVQTRDMFLAKELEDLEKTKTSLRELMKELEEKLAYSFSEGIKNITTEFTKLFEAMFGGGGAKLQLIRLPERGEDGETDEHEETGIEIAVDIPRKRIKNLDMLSGGERALTSIALLFAMSFVNPPPFLVLDETDAALDEANSQRYGAMLRNLSNKTQLIVITHNRQTMKEAGVLYGVTMGADGVSRLLSLRFEEAAQVSGKPHEGLS